MIYPDEKPAVTTNNSTAEVPTRSHNHHYNGAGRCRCELEPTLHARGCTYDLTVVFMDGTTETFPAIDSHWFDLNVLRLRCRDGGKSTVYALPLVGIRLWHRELT